MPTLNLFSIRFSDMAAANIDRVRDAVSSLPCESVGNVSHGFVASRFVDPYILPEVTFDRDPVKKDLERDGAIAAYTHGVQGSESLAYQPPMYQFGGHPYVAELRGEFLTLRFEARTQPGVNRQIHANIVEQILSNVTALNHEINRYNETLRSVARDTLDRRKAHCVELDRLRADL